MAVRVPSTSTRQPPSTRASDPAAAHLSTVGRVCRASTVASWWDCRRSVISRATARRGIHREGRPETFDGRARSTTASEKEPHDLWPPARKHRGHAVPSSLLGSHPSTAYFRSIPQPTSSEVQAFSITIPCWSGVRTLWANAMPPSRSMPVSSMPASAARFPRPQSTMTTPPAWKNTVASTSWPCQPSAS